MKDGRLYAVVVGVVILGAMLLGCARKEQASEEKAEYPAPRYPSYYAEASQAKDIEALMPYARNVARNKASTRGAGFGILNSGESVMIVPSNSAHEIVIEAVRRAMEERGVKTHVLYPYQLAGVSKEDALALQARRGGGYDDQGYREVAGWIEGSWGNPEVPREWLKQRRPDLYQALFRKEAELSPHLHQVRAKLRGENVGQAIVEYLKKHPEIRGVFWGGAIAFSARDMHPMEDKHLGSYRLDYRWELVNEIFSYPADLWVLTEQQVMDPIAFVDRVEMTDPEGTDLWFDVTEPMAAKWAKGAYIRGHILLFPDQAGGRFAYNFVDFPMEQKEWNPVEPIARLNGVIAGTIGHRGWRPHMEVHFKDGYVVDVKGGGVWGETIKEFLSFPNINDLTYPFREHPGYWHNFEIAVGTHPKFLRPTEVFDSPPHSDMGHEEIIRTGLFHLALGNHFVSDPDSRGAPRTTWKWADEHNLPRGHSNHTHTYFSTYRVHLRNTDKWMTLVDRGHMTALDNPEVRALASRYGDPDKLLAEDWIPEIPGINAPGRYEDYAKDAWKFSKAVNQKILDGTYEHFYPPKPAK